MELHHATDRIALAGALLGVIIIPTSVTARLRAFHLRYFYTVKRQADSTGLGPPPPWLRSQRVICHAS